MRTLSTTILGGLSVEIEYSIQPADPDTGIFDPYVEDWYITRVCGKKKSGGLCRVLETRIKQEGHEESLLAEMMENEDEG